MWCIMMTSSNGNIFRVTGHLCGEFTGPRWLPRTKASDAELWYFFICVWINDWVNNREAGDFRRYRAHYDVIVTIACNFLATNRTCRVGPEDTRYKAAAGSGLVEEWIYRGSFLEYKAISIKHRYMAAHYVYQYVCDINHIIIYHHIWTKRNMHVGFSSSHCRSDKYTKTI